MAHSRFDSLGQLAMKALTDPGLFHMSVILLGQWTDRLVYICMVTAEVQGDKDSWASVPYADIPCPTHVT